MTLAPSAPRSRARAVTLCSFTTLAGYISLYTSANRALNSFGLAMSIGEVTCLGASVVALPAILLLLESRRRRAADGASETDEGSTSASSPVMA